MNFNLSAKNINEIKTDALVIFVFQDKITREEKLIDERIDKQAARLRELGDLTGELSQVKILHHSRELPRILLVGAGKSKEFNLEKLRSAAAAAISALKPLAVKTISFTVPQVPGADSRLVSQELVSALLLSAYEFTEYKKPDEKKKAMFETFEFVYPNSREKNEGAKGIAAGEIISRAVITARDLGNHPSNIATPSHLAEHALRVAREGKKIKVKILHRADIQKERMGGLLGVAKGSDEEPKFIILEYRAAKTAPKIVLVGKGITFDSGGINIKPSEKMEEMKYDMTGGAAVMGIIKAASELDLPINLIALIPAAENLPSGKALKPGDIVASRSGKTVEVINTDAEGRLTLMDALDYAKQYKPDLVIDLATLTGSIVTALGDDLIGGFTNNQKKFDQLLASAKLTGEKTWQMPLMPEYEPFIKSDIADLRNQSAIRYGDAIHAANFLKNFVDYPWIHLDIAGVAWATREKPYRPKGATGAGVRLILEFLRRFKK